MRARPAIIESCELLAVVSVAPVRHSLRILAILERILDVCAVAKWFDRRSTATAERDDRGHDQLLAQPIGDAYGVRHDVRTVSLRPDSLCPAPLDLAKAPDSCRHNRRTTR